MPTQGPVEPRKDRGDYTALRQVRDRTLSQTPVGGLGAPGPYAGAGTVAGWRAYLVDDASVFNDSFSTNDDKIHFLHDVAKEIKR